MNYTKIIIAGRLTRDPELLTSKAGKPYARAAIAVDNGWGDNKVTVFYNVTMFGSRGEALAKHAKKGSAILFEGKNLTVSVWTDKEGKPRANPDLIADEFTFVGSGSGEKKERSEQPF